MTKRISVCIPISVLCLYIMGTAFGDSLTVSPAKPKTTDPVRLTIIYPNWDCCTKFEWDSTRVTMMGDTGIMLSYSYYLPEICPNIYCKNVPYLVPYKCGPLPAGTYAVWETKQRTCLPPLMCLTLPIVQKLGSFTVSGSTAVSRSVPAPAKPVGINGNARIYDLRGALVSSRNSVTLKHQPGVFLVKRGKNLAKLAH